MTMKIEKVGGKGQEDYKLRSRIINKPGQKAGKAVEMGVLGKRRKFRGRN